MALTRGASESLQIAQNGIDLKAGDEVITTEQDYWYLNRLNLRFAQIDLWITRL